MEMVINGPGPSLRDICSLSLFFSVYFLFTNMPTKTPVISTTDASNGYVRQFTHFHSPPPCITIYAGKSSYGR